MCYFLRSDHKRSISQANITSSFSKNTEFPKQVSTAIMISKKKFSLSNLEINSKTNFPGFRSLMFLASCPAVFC